MPLARLFDRGLAFTFSLTSPMLLAIGGATGAGKTTLAYRLAKEHPAFKGALVVEGDQMRRKLLGYDLKTAMPPEAYTDEVSLRVRRGLDALILETLAEGRAVIDASGFWGEESRRAIEALAERGGASFIGLWLDVPRDELERRILKRLGERATASDLTIEKGHASDACLGVLDKFGVPLPPDTKSWTVLSEGSVFDFFDQIFQ
ncbi:MAG: ATP-binding protein [Alphaproteobacteria bacterium]|nr:ATP-binding protein [Alphaproteobacteria bacterium]